MQKGLIKILTINLTGCKKILVVDDDRDLCDIIYDIITDKGYCVDHAYDGESALQEIANKFYDLLIIDHKLGKLSGINVIENSKTVQPNLQTIMISAFGNDETRSKARELGVLDFIDKPFDIGALVEKVDQIVYKD